jgi:outer membrane protein TolC
VLAEETLHGDQKRYSLGAMTAFQVIQDQRDVANATNSETQAKANYEHARISLDQAVGATLTVNHVSITEAEQGTMNRKSTLPGDVQKGVRP